MLLTMLWTQLACKTTADDTAQQAAAFTPDLPTAGCGAPAYAWLPTTEMGTLVEVSRQDDLSLSAETINLLLGGYDVTAGMVPVQHDVEVYYVRYRTQDRGEEVEATGIISFPVLSEPAEVPSLLWLHPTMGFSDSCAPTALGLEGAAFSIVFAAMGYAVAAPDYLGMAGWGAPSEGGHPYIIAEPTAIASLDSLRAMVALQAQEGLSAQPDVDRVAMWGASQGGFAALWADRYAPHYAPEFTTIATVAAVPPTDMLSLAALGVTTLGPTSLGLAASQITMNRWYGADRDLTEVLTEGVIDTLVTLIDEECEDFSALEGIEEIADVYNPDYVAGVSGGAADGYEPWSCYLDENTLRNSSVPLASDTPTLMFLAEEDDLAIAAPARADIEALCAQGYRIEHQECAGLAHADGAVASLPAQLDWLSARVAGEAWDESGVCIINEPIDCEARE